MGRGDRVDVRSRFWEGHIAGSPSGIFVNDLIDHDSYSWDAGILSRIFSEANAQALLNTPGPIRHSPDTWVWTPVATRSYTTATGFDLLS